MKKEFAMSLSQSYRQDLLDAVQLAKQGMLSPSQQAYCLRKSRTPRVLRSILQTGINCSGSCVLRWAKKRKFPSASARKPSCTSWGWNSYSIPI